MNKPLFEKYADLIRKRAHYYSEKFGVDYSELESQGFLIYCECLETFDVSKATFSTYLYTQLNRLGDFVRTYNRQQGILIQDYYSDNSEEDKINREDTIVSRPDGVEVQELLNEAKSELSDGAYQLLVWIIRREWEGKYRRTPTISMATQYFDCGRQKVEEFWKECKVFWNVKGIAIYA